MALAFAACVLVMLLGSIAVSGARSLSRTEIRLPIYFDAETINANKARPDFNKILKSSVLKYFWSNMESGAEKKAYKLFPLLAADDIRDYYKKNPDVIGKTAEVWVTASSAVDLHIKGRENNKLDTLQQELIAKLQSENRIKNAFNIAFFQYADSRMPEYAGVMGGVVGSLFSVLMCVLLSLPVGVLTAIYLNEFGKKGKLADIIEVNIANLAAVPSIIYGLLGLVIYLQFMHLPRSSALVGGLTLAVMILPTIIISSKAALSAVPDSIRQGALALGATPMQVVFHHVLPLGLPGIMTGLILGISRALGETAPLLMIGMVAFLVDIPDNIMDPATTLPVQVYLWSDHPNIAFVDKTAGCILVLVLLLFVLNFAGIILRGKFERRW